MTNIKIITNNPLVKAKYPEISEFTEAEAENVIISARNAVHGGALLLNHPLSGGILPGVSPYKSLIVSIDAKKNFHATDFASLQLIEEAVRALKKTPPNATPPDEKTIDDFQVIDLDLLDSAMLAVCPWKR